MDILQTGTEPPTDKNNIAEHVVGASRLVPETNRSNRSNSFGWTSAKHWIYVAENPKSSFGRCCAFAHSALKS